MFNKIEVPGVFSAASTDVRSFDTTYALSAGKAASDVFLLEETSNLSSCGHSSQDCLLCDSLILSSVDPTCSGPGSCARLQDQVQSIVCAVL